MRKWLPYVLAAVVGIGLAVVLLLPGSGGGGKGGGGGTAGGARTSTTTSGGAGGEGTPVDRMKPTDPARASTDPPPPPGTLRPMNPAEEAQQKRESRAFNQHTNRVQSYWLQAARLMTGQPELAAECKAMMEYVREQSRLDEGELDQNAVITKELELVKKAREATSGNPELAGILDYIDSSANAVIQGGDPTLVPKPSEKR